MGKKVIYQQGEKVGHLTFIKVLTKGKHRRALFQCHCGNTVDAQIDNVLQGKPKSCGCDKATVTVDGVKKCTPEYNSWASMLQRCYNPTHNQYHNYGGRGITVCDRWLHSFKAFLSDLGRRPTFKMSLDRIDVNGNYEPSNTRWATQKEQLRNTRSNFMITYNGQTKCLAEWSEVTRISHHTLRSRLISPNWSIEDSLTIKPVTGKNQWR